MKRIYFPAAVLLLVANVLIIARMFMADIHLGEMKPTIRYFTSLQVEAVLHGDDATIKAYLPSTGAHQTVVSEKVESSRLAITGFSRAMYSISFVGDAAFNSGVGKKGDTHISASATSIHASAIGTNPVNVTLFWSPCVSISDCRTEISDSSPSPIRTSSTSAIC